MKLEDITMMGTVGWLDQIFSPAINEDIRRPPQDDTSHDTPDDEFMFTQPHSRSGRGCGQVSDPASSVPEDGLCDRVR
jgi:hypothetical protein